MNKFRDKVARKCVSLKFSMQRALKCENNLCQFKTGMGSGLSELSWESNLLMWKILLSVISFLQTKPSYFRVPSLFYCETVQHERLTPTGDQLHRFDFTYSCGSNAPNMTFKHWNTDMPSCVSAWVTATLIASTETIRLWPKREWQSTEQHIFIAPFRHIQPSSDSNLRN